MFLDPVLTPLLSLPPLLAIAVISFAVSLIITIVYKYTTNQQMMKEFKEESKQLRQKMKELKNEPQKLAELNKKALEKQMKVMVHSFKPTLFTIIPLILIFGWFNAHYSYGAILPGADFTTTMKLEPGTTGQAKLLEQQGITILSPQETQISGDQANWTLKGEAGEYLLEYEFQNETYTKELIVSEKQQYAPLSKAANGNAVVELRINNPDLKVLNLFGIKLGWLGTYILFSFALTLLLRKIMKVY